MVHIWRQRQVRLFHFSNCIFEEQGSEFFSQDRVGARFSGSCSWGLQKTNLLYVVCFMIELY